MRTPNAQEIALKAVLLAVLAAMILGMAMAMTGQL